MGQGELKMIYCLNFKSDSMHFPIKLILLKGRVSYCRHLASVHCPSITFLTLIVCKTAEPNGTKLGSDDNLVEEIDSPCGGTIGGEKGWAGVKRRFK